MVLVGGGSQAGYLETHHAIEIANAIFKPNGWSTEVRHVEHDYVSARVAQKSAKCARSLTQTIRRALFFFIFGSCTARRHRRWQIDHSNRRWSIGVSCIIRVTLPDG